VVIRWECLRGQNHFFDALYYAAAAGWYYGVRLADELQPVKPKRLTLAELKQMAGSKGGQCIDSLQGTGIRELMGW
jgi:hypothetical protein